MAVNLDTAVAILADWVAQQPVGTVLFFIHRGKFSSGIGVETANGQRNAVSLSRGALSEDSIAALRAAALANGWVDGHG
jgi:hypothetical protein